jgi:heme/copper-type cytochrome/quinol oxidase subunit 2
LFSNKLELLYLKYFKMNKTTKIILWSVAGIAVIAGTYYAYAVYRKVQTTSADPEKNDRKIQVVLNKEA